MQEERIESSEVWDAYQEARSSLESTLDVNQLLKRAREQQIQTKSLAQIAQENLEVLSELGLSEATLRTYCRKLVDYEYIDVPENLVLGKYMRWLRIPVPGATTEPKLVTGGKLMDVRYQDNDETMVVVFAGNRVTQFKFEPYLTFQKLSEEEQVILYALGGTNGPPYTP